MAQARCISSAEHVNIKAGVSRHVHNQGCQFLRSELQVPCLHVGRCMSMPCMDAEDRVGLLWFLNACQGLRFGPRWMPIHCCMLHTGALPRARVFP